MEIVQNQCLAPGKEIISGMAGPYISLLHMSTEKCKARKHMRRCPHIPTAGTPGDYVLKPSDSFTRARFCLARHCNQNFVSYRCRTDTTVPRNENWRCSISAIRYKKAALSFSIGPMLIRSMEIVNRPRGECFRSLKTVILNHPKADPQSPHQNLANEHEYFKLMSTWQCA